ncbi:MAG: DsrE family protein [Rubrimonas sp.]|uniref:DsrE family protein n=1 Tax=Rubrimonas sp. TaxID=2036015 RepID=UPI002FDD191D
MKTTTLAFGLAMALAAGAASAEPAMKVAIHVDEQDIQTMVMALNNAANIQKYYADKGEEVQIEIVAYGPGLHMFRKDTSPVADRIEMMAMESDSIAFSACLNTVESMERKEDKDVPLLDEVAVTPSGAVRLIELQKEGWTYLRP